MVYAVQGEKNSRKIRFDLFNNGVKWVIDRTANVLISYKKPDGNGGMYDVLDNGESAFEFAEDSTNSVIITLAEQVLTTVGNVPLLVSFMVEDKILSTFSIILDVSENPGIDAAESVDYFSLQVAIEAAKKAAGDMFDPTKIATKEYVDGKINDIDEFITEAKEGAKTFYVKITEQEGVFTADKNIVAIDAAYKSGRAIKALVIDNGEEITVPIIGIIEGDTAFYAGYGAYGNYVVISQTDNKISLSFREIITQEHLDQINAQDVGAIPVPLQAQVGQTIIVTEVDDNRKPIKWSTANLGSGEGGSSGNAVLFIPQLLNDDQQEQARKNIGIDDLSAAGASVFKGRKASFYGDSLTEINGHYTKGYHKWLSDALRLASYNNYGVSGYRFSNVYSKVNSINDTADIIFVMCGVGEQTYGIPLGAMGDNTTDTTYGALELLCSLLKQKYPSKLVVFITPSYQTKYPHSEGITSYEVSKAIRDVCEKYAIPVYDNFVLSGIYDTNLSIFTTDNCHWNDTAHEMVGKNLSKFMLNTFGYVYGLPSVDDGGTTFEVTSVWNSDMFNVTLYVAAEDLPKLNHENLNISFDIEPISEMPTLEITQMSYTHSYDVINDLKAGNIVLGTNSMEITNHQNGIYTISGNTTSITTPLTKPYIGFSTPFAFSVGDKFKIKNAQITHGANNIEIYSIGGAFKEEILTTTNAE